MWNIYLCSAPLAQPRQGVKFARIGDDRARLAALGGEGRGQLGKITCGAKPVRLRRCDLRRDSVVSGRTYFGRGPDVLSDAAEIRRRSRDRRIQTGLNRVHHLALLPEGQDQARLMISIVMDRVFRNTGARVAADRFAGVGIGVKPRKGRR